MARMTTRFLLAAALVGLLLAVAARLHLIPVGLSLHLLPALAAAAFIGGLIAALLHQPQALAAAGFVDQHLQLKERVSSAWASFARSDQPFEKALLADTTRRLGKVSPSHICPLRLPFEAAVLALACFGIFALLAEATPRAPERARLLRQWGFDPAGQAAKRWEALDALTKLAPGAGNLRAAVARKDPAALRTVLENLRQRLRRGEFSDQERAAWRRAIAAARERLHEQDPLRTTSPPKNDQELIDQVSRLLMQLAAEARTSPVARFLERWQARERGVTAEPGDGGQVSTLGRGPSTPTVVPGEIRRILVEWAAARKIVEQELRTDRIPPAYRPLVRKYFAAVAEAAR